VAGKDGFGWHFALLSGTGADRPWLAGNPTPLKGWWIAGCRKELLGFIDLTPASASMPIAKPKLMEESSRGKDRNQKARDRRGPRAF